VPLVGALGAIDVDGERLQVAQVVGDALGEDRPGLLVEPARTGELGLETISQGGGDCGRLHDGCRPCPWCAAETSAYYTTEALTSPPAPRPPGGSPSTRTRRPAPRAPNTRNSGRCSAP